MHDTHPIDNHQCKRLLSLIMTFKPLPISDQCHLCSSVVSFFIFLIRAHPFSSFPSARPTMAQCQYAGRAWSQSSSAR